MPGISLRYSTALYKLLNLYLYPCMVHLSQGSLKLIGKSFTCLQNLKSPHWFMIWSNYLALAFDPPHNLAKINPVPPFLLWSEVAQLCPTLCDPMDCSLQGSSARVLEWVAISFSRGFSRPKDWTLVSRVVGRRFTIWAFCYNITSVLWFGFLAARHVASYLPHWGSNLKKQSLSHWTARDVPTQFFLQPLFFLFWTSSSLSSLKSCTLSSFLNLIVFLTLYVEVEQNMPPPNLPLWHVDCSEQKAIKTQQTQEKLFYLSLNCLTELYRGPVPESLREGNGNPLQYSCLENCIDRGAWWATVCGVAKTWRDWATNTVPERAITRDSFFFFLSERHICMASQTFAYQSFALPIFLIVSLLFEAPDPYCFLLSLRWYICLSCQTIFESWWGFCKYVVKLIFVLLICFISIQILDQQNIILDEHFPGHYTPNPILLICEVFLYSSRSS